ncbi:Uncharacterised protein [BD1-7 clade bacterium]|uniref:Uncharacterized protein n=1 Tax=BD1-7 clade bacterium TaxID=2029982 RepID=A0A5S9QT34_9GAMM|nr:Uncharacterised protein [BD1-7 clade bacterium]
MSRLFVVVLIIFLGGCDWSLQKEGEPGLLSSENGSGGVSSGSGGGGTSNNRNGSFNLTVINNSDTDINALRVQPITETDWGPNLVRPARTIPSDGGRILRRINGCNQNYNFRVEDRAGNLLKAEFDRFAPCDTTLTWILFNLEDNS